MRDRRERVAPFQNVLLSPVVDKLAQEEKEFAGMQNNDEDDEE